METKTCESCKFCVVQDYGYSNYTVEGREFHCALSKHPRGVFDQWYGETNWEEEMAYANECDGFTPGESIFIDVDGEALEWLSPEQKEVLEMLRETA